jgi:hypothetical protein
VLQVGHEEVRDPEQQGHLAKDRPVQMRVRHGRGELELETMPQVRHSLPELTAQLSHFLPELAAQLRHLVPEDERSQRCCGASDSIASGYPYYGHVGAVANRMLKGQSYRRPAGSKRSSLEAVWATGDQVK